MRVSIKGAQLYARSMTHHEGVKYLTTVFPAMRVSEAASVCDLNADLVEEDDHAACVIYRTRSVVRQ
jgi:hypothetical protein